MATENPYVAAMSELKETTVTAGPGTIYTNVTMATVTCLERLTKMSI